MELLEAYGIAGVILAIGVWTFGLFASALVTAFSQKQAPRPFVVLGAVVGAIVAGTAFFFIMQRWSERQEIVKPDTSPTIAEDYNSPTTKKSPRSEPTDKPTPDGADEPPPVASSPSIHDRLRPAPPAARVPMREPELLAEGSPVPITSAPPEDRLWAFLGECTYREGSSCRFRPDAPVRKAAWFIDGSSTQDDAERILRQNGLAPSPGILLVRCPSTVSSPGLHKPGCVAVSSSTTLEFVNWENLGTGGGMEVWALVK